MAGYTKFWVLFFLFGGGGFGGEGREVNNLTASHRRMREGGERERVQQLDCLAQKDEGGERERGGRERERERERGQQLDCLAQKDEGGEREMSTTRLPRTEGWVRGEREVKYLTALRRGIEREVNYLTASHRESPNQFDPL